MDKKNPVRGVIANSDPAAPTDSTNILPGSSTSPATENNSSLPGSDLAISVVNLTKVYKLYDTPLDRVKEAIHLFGKKFHKDFYALKDINFEVKKGETVGIVGKNGSGKSTLLKILTGVLTPSSGGVTVNGKVSALLELGAGFNPELTGIENVYFNGTLLGYTKAEIDEKVDDILSFADIGGFVNQPVKTYSSGMFVRLAFSVATIVDPEILIVDEALSVGDIFFQQKCYRKLENLRDEGVTIMFVTHSMGDVIQFCRRAILLNDSRLEYMGPSSEAVKRYLLVQQQHRLEAVKEIPPQKPEPLLKPFEEDGDSLYWPDTNQFSDIINVNAVSNGFAHCTAFALCNNEGIATKLFAHGDVMTIYCEFTMEKSIDVPIGGFLIKNAQNVMVHGKNSLHYDDLKLPSRIDAGSKLRLRFDISLDIAPGQYTVDIGLSTVAKKDYDSRDYSPPDHTQAMTIRLCHLTAVDTFTVFQKSLLDQDYSTLHMGVCNLSGSCDMSVATTLAS